jgi:hypothetical protein
MAKVTGAELLHSLRAEADRLAALGIDLRDRIGTLADPTAAEAEVEAVGAAAEQRAAPPGAACCDTPPRSRGRPHRAGRIARPSPLARVSLARWRSHASQLTY